MSNRPVWTRVEVLAKVDGGLAPEVFEGPRVSSTLIDSSGRARVLVLDESHRPVECILYRRVEWIKISWTYGPAAEEKA